MSSKQIYISAKYWAGLKPFEQEYIRTRIGRDDLPTMKQIIREARKQHPSYTKIYGKGFISLPDGTELLYSGTDTRTFIPLSNND